MTRDGTPRAFVGCQLSAFINPVPSSARPCWRCARNGLAVTVWVSWPLLRLVDTGEFTPICLECLDALEAEGVDLIAKVHPDQVDQLHELGLMGYADQFVTVRNRERHERQKRRAHADGPSGKPFPLGPSR